MITDVSNNNIDNDDRNDYNSNKDNGDGSNNANISINNDNVKDDVDNDNSINNANVSNNIKRTTPITMIIGMILEMRFVAKSVQRKLRDERERTRKSSKKRRKE